jgi:hypothetical protein
MGKKDITIPMPPLPSSRDPIWKLGHQVVELLLDYMADIPPKADRCKK